MKRIRIIHNTQYHYRQPVTFGTHRAMLRPREGHDVHIVKARLDIGPPATLRWLRDIYGNSIAVIDFQEAGKTLSILSEVDVDLYADNPIECLIEPTARLFPFPLCAGRADRAHCVPPRPAIPMTLRRCRHG